MTDRILILTPTLGTSVYLDETLQSVRGCEGRIRHLLVCPASKVDDLRARYPTLEVVVDQGKEAGLYGALNAGLAAAGDEWDWFTYINDDDALTPAFARLMAQHIQTKAAASVAFGDIMNVDDAGKPLGRMTIESDPRWIPALLQQGISPLGQQGMLFGKPVVRALGGYRLKFRLCADLDFWARAMAANFRFVYYPWTVGRFRIQAGQLSSDVALTRREQDAITAECFPEPVPPLARRIARLRYRLWNAPRYLERMQAFGFATSNQVLARGGRRASNPQGS